jgi:hypothetical protein
LWIAVIRERVAAHMSVRESLSKSLTGLGKRVAPQQPASLPAVAEKKTPGWIIVLTFIGATVLLIVGVLVLIAGREMWQHPGNPQVSHPTKATFEVVKAPVKIVKANGTTRRKLSAVKRVKTVERLGQGGGRSETVALATLATGAALLLAGAFAARLTKIKLPGVEMDAETLSTVSAVAGAQVADAAKEEGREDVLKDKAKFAEATKITLLAGLEGQTRTAVAVAMGEEPLLAVEMIDEEKMQKAAEVAVQKVSDET